MSKPRIHAAYCRCAQCAPRHPAATDISPALTAGLLTFAIAAGMALLAWAGSCLTEQLSTWSSSL
ncbi:hypothetical protein [Novosphingobium sp. Leaf2]|uniref:hypothetical protein n=1 Tax=Novosphingobium sp. Leaf2 TaxID=1735670 RepID=UPI0006F5E8DE|nr:hypothetical protein [Novosphingobium sp. Leaf2]